MWYFAYGSNLCRSRLRERIGSAPFDRIARLTGHELRFHKRGRDGSGKADAYATGSPDHAVWGALVELDTRQLATLDRHEPGYGRLVVEVELSEDDLRSPAHVYIAHPAAVDPSAVPFTWYREMVVAGGAARGLPNHYLARIAAIPAQPGLETPPLQEMC